MKDSMPNTRRKLRARKGRGIEQLEEEVGKVSGEFNEMKRFLKGLKCEW